MLIDWHSHHTAPEVVEQITQLTGKRPQIDQYDSPDFSRRVKELDTSRLDVQLVCQGASLNADRFPPELAISLVKRSNDLIARGFRLIATACLA